jgi:hypothetical protein
MLILSLVVVTAICFDFTNGFHDTANAVATSIATGALKPRDRASRRVVLPGGRGARHPRDGVQDLSARSGC